MNKYRLNINGKEVTGFAGQTILEVARENDIFIFHRIGGILRDAVDPSRQDQNDIPFFYIVRREIQSYISLSFFNVNDLHIWMPVERNCIEVERDRAQIGVVREKRIGVRLRLHIIFIFKTIHIYTCLIIISFSYYILSKQWHLRPPVLTFRT